MARPGEPVTIIAKTAAQQQRSAWYTWAVAAGLVCLTLATAVNMSERQIRVLWPRQADQIMAVAGIIVAVGGVGGAGGAFALGRQKMGSVKDEHQVDRSAGAGGDGNG